ncbi:uncharacterized protein LOC129585597 [Paramacrobiotus metropolitanus]|uniref:uncharacterized protein LOC129585597 n=1 Tax=Paramacrobiotus metropolitanus TaxID=2943436 RepID=UPI002446397D|nr:uncharacterized protein LOC129585597 [Paramacrobiotus metropolitanus]
MEASSNAVPLLPDGESFHDTLYCDACQCFLREPCWQHAVLVQDGYSLPLAFASLPDVLAFHNDNPHQNVCQSPENITVSSVVARTAIRPQTVFGPFIGPLCSPGAAHSRTFSSGDGQCATFSVENDRWCNWMKLVRTADHGQHNLRVFIRQHKVYFVAVKVILPGEELTLALPQSDHKESRHNNVDNTTAVSVERVRSGTVAGDDSCLVKREDYDAEVDNVEGDVPVVCFSVDARSFSPHYNRTDFLPQFQPSVPVQSQEQMLTGFSCLVAPPPALRRCQREDSPEYPFPSNFCSVATDALSEKAVHRGKRKSEEEESAGVSSKQTPFSRVYSLRGRNVVRASAADDLSDRYQNLSDDNDEDFCLADDSGSSFFDSECDSETNLTSDNTTTKKQNTKRGTKEKAPSSRRCRKKTGSVVCKATETVLVTNDSSTGNEPIRLPGPAFLEARNKQIRAVIAVNPFQYPAGEQRLQAYCTVVNMLSTDQASPGMPTLDGPMLQRSVKDRLRKFQAAQRRGVSMPEEYVGLMNQLAALRRVERLDTRSERMRRLKAVAAINPFQYSSRRERRAAWTAAWQAYLADDGAAKKAKFSCSSLQRFVQTHLDDFPNVLDRFNEDTADDYEREYIEVMRVIAQQAGKDYADDAHPLAVHKDVDAVGVGQLNVADTLNTHPKPLVLDNYEHDRRRRYFSYVYRFVCWECSLHFKDENLLKLHNLQHTDATGEAAGARQCPACERSFSQLSNLLRHVNDHGVKASQIIHFIPTADPSIMSLASKTAAPMDVLAQSHDAHEMCFMYSCGMQSCGLRFCTETLCDLHQLGHNVPDDYQGDVVCPACNFRAENARELLKHVGRHGAKVNDRKRCRLCGEFVENMILHVQYAHKEQYLKYEESLTLPCDQCEKRFRTSVHLTTHKNCAHRGLQSLGCLVCAQQFPSKLQLHAHVRQEHRSGLTCVVCQKSSTNYKSLAEHARTHKEIHICQTCGSVFRSKSGLDQHKYSHRSDYSFKCDLCGKTFKRPSNLAQHKMVVHTDKVRKKRKAEREEMRRKGVVSEYKCPRRRMRYEEFPYKCEECRLGWLQLGNLQQHQRKKHMESDATAASSASFPVSSSCV